MPFWNLLKDTLLTLGAVVVITAIVTRGIDGLIAIGVVALFVFLFGGIVRRLIAFLEGLLNYGR